MVFYFLAFNLRDTFPVSLFVSVLRVPSVYVHLSSHIRVYDIVFLVIRLCCFLCNATFLNYFVRILFVNEVTMGRQHCVRVCAVDAQQNREADTLLSVPCKWEPPHSRWLF
jgi:hypothetical protein